MLLCVMAYNTSKKRKAFLVPEVGAATGKATKMARGGASSAPDTCPSSAQASSGYEALGLPQIQAKLRELCDRVPSVPDGGIDGTNQEEVRTWATKMQACLEEFGLHLGLVSSATYKWGTDRSGAADQNLALLGAELGNAQEQISTSITPRLTNVLAPVVDLVIKKTVTRKEVDPETGKEEEIKLNTFSRELVDPNFVELCGTILSRNAVMLRQVVLANFSKVDRVIDDFIKACEKDQSHDSRGFAY